MLPEVLDVVLLVHLMSPDAADLVERPDVGGPLRGIERGNTTAHPLPQSTCVREQRDPKAVIGQAPRLLDGQPGLAAAGAAADLDASQQPRDVEDRRLLAAEPLDHLVALGHGLLDDGRLQLGRGESALERGVDRDRVRHVAGSTLRVLHHEQVAKTVGDLVQVATVADHVARAVGHLEPAVDLAVGERHGVRPPDGGLAGPRHRVLDPVAQGVLGAQGLLDRIDRVRAGATGLLPPPVLDPDGSALDLHDHDAEAVEDDGDVELVVTLARHEALVRDQEVARAQLVAQRLPHDSFGCVDELGRGRPEERIGHGCSLRRRWAGRDVPTRTPSCWS